jgi:hypothetical protein
MKQETQKVQKDQISEEVTSAQVWNDLKNSILLVSLFVNLTILTGWIALQVSSRYDAAMASFLFG